MAFKLWAEKIHCPNCHYEGTEKILGAGCAGWILWLGILIVSFFFWPLFIVTGIMFFWLLLKPAKGICPKCKWPNPIPLEQWKKGQANSPSKGG